MNSRFARPLLVVGAFLAGLFVCFGVILLASGRGPTSSAIPAVAIGGPFSLVDQNGKSVTDADMKGKPFLVFFGFTHCPDVCPTTLFEASEVMKALGRDAERVGMLFVTVDPERDTPAAMKEYLSNFDPHLRALTGDAAALAAVAKSYRVYYKKVPLDGGDYTMDHTAIVYLMDKNGRFVAPFSFKRTPDAAAAELRKAI
jgi:protein SCO1/2